MKKTSPLLTLFYLALILPLSLTARAAENPLMEYKLDLVSNYVSRGVDLHRSVFAKEGEKDGAFNLSPALQPSLTFFGPGAFSFNIWGSFALVNREEEVTKSFTGLKTLDEVDYSLLWDWENKLGAFTVGLSNYSNPSTNGAANEIFISWKFPFMKSLSPKLSHYSELASAATYTSLAIGGGDALSWSLSLGKSVALQDLTGSLGYAFGNMSVSFNGAYRPNPELVGSYNDKGKYTLAGNTEDYPPAVFWIAFSYGGKVKN